MALIDLMREALRFLPSQTHRFLRVVGANGKVTLFSSDFRPLYPIWSTYGQPELPDEYEAFERAAADIKAALPAKHDEDDDGDGLKPASGPVCALHVEAKDEFAVVENGKWISLIDGEYALAITGELRKVVGDQTAKAFAVADGETNKLIGLELCTQASTYQAQPFNSHPLIPLHLTSVRKVVDRWSRAQCAVNLTLLRASKSPVYTINRNGRGTLQWHGNDIKHLLASVDDAFLELDDQQTVIFYDLLEHNRVRLYWETALACYSWVMRLHEP